MKIAITGGIGSGKSYVCRILEKQGIRVYDCDAEAKRLMRTDARLQAGLKKLVGDQVIALNGALSGEAGIALIAGTGSICFGKNGAGEYARSGGWGQIGRAHV